MSTLAGILLICFFASFTFWVLAIFIKPLRIKEKLRYNFYLLILLFGLSFAFGWIDFKAGFAEGYNNCGNNDSAEVQVENPQVYTSETVELDNEATELNSSCS